MSNNIIKLKEWYDFGYYNSLNRKEYTNSIAIVTPLENGEVYCAEENWLVGCSGKVNVEDIGIFYEYMSEFNYDSNKKLISKNDNTLTKKIFVNEKAIIGLDLKKKKIRIRTLYASNSWFNVEPNLFEEIKERVLKNEEDKTE